MSSAYAHANTHLRFVASAAFVLLLLANFACGPLVGSGGSAGLSESCGGIEDCDQGMACETVVPGQAHKQCTLSCTLDSQCEKVDSLGVCHAETCVRSCGKDADCPTGASCSAQIGGGCYQN